MCYISGPAFQNFQNFTPDDENDLAKNQNLHLSRLITELTWIFLAVRMAEKFRFKTRLESYYQMSGMMKSENRGCKNALS